MKKIKLKMNIISAILTAVVIVCVILFNSIFGMIADRLQLNLDLTGDSVYEFSDLTIETMKSLDNEVTAYALFPEDSQMMEYKHLKQQLEMYAALNDKFLIKYVDVYENPEFMSKFGDEAQKTGTAVIIESGDKFKALTVTDLYLQSGYDGSMTLDAERQITNSVRYVTGQLTDYIVYFTKGHEEGDDSALRSVIGEEGYECKYVDLSTSKIEDDASIIISVLPKKDFTPSEISAIDEFTNNGGSFVLLSFSEVAKLKNLAAFTHKWGMDLNADLVMDNNLFVHGEIHVYELALQPCEINDAMIAGGVPFESPLAANTIEIIKSPNGAKVTSLLKSTPDSYAKQNPDAEDLAPEDGDIPGPHDVAAIADNGKGKVCVIGSGYSLLVGEILYSEMANYDFTLNLMSSLSGGVVETGIRPKSISPDVLTIEQKEADIIIAIVKWVIPLGLFAAAIFVFVRRRYR